MSFVLRRATRAIPVLRGSLLRIPTPISKAIPQASRCFSSTPRRMGSGESDSQLSAALAAEHAFEVEEASALGDSTPEFLEAFKDAGIWEVKDVSMVDDVVLVRKFGNEVLKLTFQISDLSDPDLPIDITPLESETDIPTPPNEDSPLEGNDPEIDPPYVTCSLNITKSGTKGSLAFDLEAGNEGWEVTNVAVFEGGEGELEGAEGDWIRRGKYMGPQFDHLDPSVQDAFIAYLNERGVDDSLSQFILKYSEHKEQKDYVTWLDAVKSFVDK